MCNCASVSVEIWAMQRTLAFLGLLFGLLSIQIFSASALEKKQKVVTTLLNAKWSRTPFVLETAEFLASENNEYFWAFVEYFAEPDNVDLETKLSDEELYKRAITFCSR